MKVADVKLGAKLYETASGKIWEVVSTKHGVIVISQTKCIYPNSKGEIEGFVKR